MKKVIFLPQTIDYFKELTDILYYKNYFGFKESAKTYVDKLIDDIENTLPIRPSKISPAYFNRYGKNMRYVTFRTSLATQWYVFFNIYREKGELYYLVRFITNNHTSAQFLSHE